MSIWVGLEKFYICFIFISEKLFKCCVESNLNELIGWLVFILFLLFKIKKKKGGGE